MTDIVEIATPGPQGPPGQDGVESPFRYVHDQPTPASTWTVVHNLDGYPNVAVVDSADSEVVGGVEYLDANTIELTFSGAFSGRAFLS